jgi:hypothetical protein
MASLYLNPALYYCQVQLISMLFAHRDEKDQAHIYQLMESSPVNSIIIITNTHMEQNMHINVCTTVSITHANRTNRKTRVDTMIMLVIFISWYCQVITYLGSKAWTVQPYVRTTSSSKLMSQSILINKIKRDNLIKGR